MQVLCEHPKYARALVPATVQRSVHGQLVAVFYDNTAVDLKDAAAYRLPDQAYAHSCMMHACMVQAHHVLRLYDQLVAFAAGKDKQWLRKRVIARYPQDGLFYDVSTVSYCLRISLTHVIGVCDARGGGPHAGSRVRR